MLKALVNKLGGSAPAEMSELASVQSALASANELLNSKTAELSSVLEKLAQFESEHSSLSAALEAATAKLAEAEAFNSAMAEKALQEKADKRKAALVALVGTTKADATMTATSSLDDVAFEAVCAALTTTLEKEEESFKEVGASVVADNSGVTAEEKILSAKYNKKQK